MFSCGTVYASIRIGVPKLKHIASVRQFTKCKKIKKGSRRTKRVDKNDIIKREKCPVHPIFITDCCYFYLFFFLFFFITYSVPSRSEKLHINIYATNEPWLCMTRTQLEELQPRRRVGMWCIPRYLYRFRPHRAYYIIIRIVKLSKKYKPFESFFRFIILGVCVFFFLFPPTPNNRISDIFWGGKLISPLSLPPLLTIQYIYIIYLYTAHNLKKHDQNA